MWLDVNFVSVGNLSSLQKQLHYLRSSTRMKMRMNMRRKGGGIPAIGFAFRKRSSSSQKVFPSTWSFAVSAEATQRALFLRGIERKKAAESWSVVDCSQIASSFVGGIGRSCKKRLTELHRLQGQEA